MRVLWLHQQLHRGAYMRAVVGVTLHSAGPLTYELSHCAIQPAGSFGRLGSVGPESGETGGWGGVGAAMLGGGRRGAEMERGNKYTRLGDGRKERSRRVSATEVVNKALNMRQERWIKLLAVNHRGALKRLCPHPCPACVSGLAPPQSFSFVGTSTDCKATLLDEHGHI